MNKRNSQDSPWRAAAMVTAIGMDLVVCMLGGYWLGSRAGRLLGGPIWTVAGIMVGFFSWGLQV